MAIRTSFCGRLLLCGLGAAVLVRADVAQARPAPVGVAAGSVGVEAPAPVLRSAVLVVGDVASIPTPLPAPPGDTIRAPRGLVPGDVIRLRIWREPDLSGEFPVDADGVVVFPKIGTERVTGESQEELRARLVARYGEYLRNPSIEVTFLRRINVLGSVRAPGLIVVDPTMVVADAIALVGGITPDGRKDQIRLLRGGEVLTADISQRTRIADLPLQSGDQLYVPEKGWFSRNGIGATFVSAGLSLVSVLLTIAITK